MIQYILESIAFQLVFLIIYDMFLKRETFFQWNRLYLIGTYAVSLVLPWVKIEALKTTVPEQYYLSRGFLWQMDEITVSPATSTSFLSDMPWYVMLFFVGMTLAACLFAYKLYKIQGLRNRGDIRHFPKFTQIVIANSSLAFSFFRSIFLGDRVLEKDHDTIIRHELVHIEQRHTWDLLFFELMRIGCWFNPLVYIYQGRVSELHEFIADAQVAKTDKKESYQLLLSEVFQTEHISFINQFFNSSLTRLNVLGKIISFGSQYGQVKKRIVMLQKAKSKKIWKLKYLALVPLVAGMLFYTSCESDISSNVMSVDTNGTMIVDDIEKLSEEEETKVVTKLLDFSKNEEDWIFQVKDHNTTVTFSQAPEGSGIFGPNGIPIKARMHIESKVLDEDFDFFEIMSHSLKTEGVDVPFAVIDEVPIFPGCEDASDKRACFNTMIQKHISKNFLYPQAAQEQGIQGRVSIMFVIGRDGSITDIRQRGPYKLLEDEAHRIIAKLPKMTPGKQKGHAVRVPFSIPIAFKLEQSGFNTGAGQSQKESTANTSSQNEVDGLMGNSTAVPFANLDEVPIFPACENASDRKACFIQKIQRHIAKNFNYPEDAQERGVQGRVSIVFTITEDGLIDNIKYRGPDPSLEAEAERIIKKLPRMTAGKSGGKSVSTAFSIPITFKLQGDSAQKQTSNTNTSQTDAKKIQVSGYRDKDGKSGVYGTVSDGSRGLPGVNITVQGSSIGVVSDFDGRFAIEAQKGDVIAFQYTGLPTATLTVTDQDKYLVEAIR